MASLGKLVTNENAETVYIYSEIKPDIINIDPAVTHYVSGEYNKPGYKK